MPDLSAREWRLKYSPDDGDLVNGFYIPALECAVRYDRTTGYFGASALALAMRGIEGLVRNGGHMRLIVGCTLDAAEIEAIERGEALRDAVERHIELRTLAPPDESSREALELLAWMIGHGYLDVKVAVPCDASRRPLHADGIFHEKTGVIEDASGNALAFCGSLNETYSGWKRNWETFNVFTSWNSGAEYVAPTTNEFARIWANQSSHVMTLDVPAAMRLDLMRFLPPDDRPARLRGTDGHEFQSNSSTHTSPPTEPAPDPRQDTWAFIRRAPTDPDGGARVGEATCAVEPWPHQIRAFERMYGSETPRLLIADEVGLGKTIQAGMLLRQMWMAGRARRILILTPAAVMSQWQLELREKFNLNWPVYDDGTLTWAASRALGPEAARAVSRDEWHREPFVIASSHLMRRQDRVNELCEAADPWDLIVLDEAHHARRRGAGSGAEEGPNALLKLMRRLRHRTKGLVLLTATPMQVDPIETWDLLDLLGLPPAWTAAAFLRFFALVRKDGRAGRALISFAEMDELARLFQATEEMFGPVGDELLVRQGIDKRIRRQRILYAMRDQASGSRQILDAADRDVALRLVRSATPVSRLISRHTRDLLRRYHHAGKISTPIADREVCDEFIEMSAAERAVYTEVEQYISTTYNQASPDAKNAVGFVMTVYRRRLASSFRALRATLENRLNPAARATATPQRWAAAADDAGDDDSSAGAHGDVMDADDALRLAALAREEQEDVAQLYAHVGELPMDTKARRLGEVLEGLRADGYTQCMVFTQFTDTMDFLREYVRSRDTRRVLCFSGRGGEALGSDGRWTLISRDETKRRFRDGDADVLLCTDAAAEGLNFQFCGALVNYDMPWNPMRVEQRIGRIDRLGQQHKIVRIVNLHYRDTVETDVYMALRTRIQLFQSVVGRLQPILAALPRAITETVLHGGGSPEARRAAAVSEVSSRIASLEHDASALDLDELSDDAIETRDRPEPTLTLAMLDRVICRPDLMPPGITVRPLGDREYAYHAPGMAREVRVTTDARLFEANSENYELWSPGSPVFPTAP